MMKPVAVVNITMLATGETVECLIAAGYDVVQVVDGPPVVFNNPAAEQRERIAAAVFAAIVPSKDPEYSVYVTTAEIGRGWATRAIELADILIKELNK